MIRWLPAVLAATLLPLGGCAAEEPGDVDALVVISGPKAFHSFELRDDAERVLWRLVADPPAPVSELVYGDVPAGFRQESPGGGGRPRQLIVGELLRLESVTPLRVFQHEGWVESGPRLSIEHWQMELRHPPQRVELDGEPADS
jgi:hypothetical protein